MSSEIEKKAEGAPKRNEKPLTLLSYLWHLLRHNLGWKILALILAVGLWAGLITQDPTLVRERTFADVQVNITGADTLKKNGFVVVSDLVKQSPTVRLRVDVPQKEYNTVSASNYNVRIDLSRITETGKQVLKIIATSSGTYGNVQEITPDTLEVEVEEYITRYRIPVTVVREGEIPQGFYSSTPTLDPPLVAVSGPASLVNSVVRAVAAFDQSNLPAREGLVRTGVPFVLVDANGEEVKSDLIQVTSESVLLDSVVVEQALYTTRLMDLSQLALVAGNPASGYQVKNVTVTPTQILAAGRAEELNAIENLFVETPVNLEGATESFHGVIKVRKPSEIVYLSSDSVTVSVELGPVITNRTFENIRINTEGLAQGLSAKLSNTKAGVTLQGPQLWLQNLNDASVIITADLTGLSQGSHRVTLICTVKDSQGITYTYSTDPLMVEAVVTGN